MKCMMCGSKLKKKKVDNYHYVESGLSKIYLKGIEVYSCSNSECGEEELVIPNTEKLHNLIAQELASQKNKLLPEEIRFLRVHLGFSGADFAKAIGVSPETVTRWEKGKVKMKESTEKVLRLLVLTKAGPFRNYEDLESFASTQRATPVERSFKPTRQSWTAWAA